MPPISWQPDVVQIMDDHHLVAWSDSPRRRLQFGAALAAFLMRQRDTEVCTFHGRCIACIESFCEQLEKNIPGPPLARRVDGIGGITSLLRLRAETAAFVPSKYRYYIWHDADALLRRDRVLFGRLADAIMGVAAEAEFASDELLLIHRAVFVGSSMLDRYAADPDGQLQSWVNDGQGDPFWQVVTGVDRPPVMRYCADLIWNAPARAAEPRRNLGGLATE